MASFNQVILIGNLCADPELNHANDKPVTTIRIAVTQKYKKKDADKPEVDFINIVCWEHNAEFVSNHFKKGDGIFICGSLHTWSFVDKNNETQYRSEVRADEVKYVGHRKGGSNDKNNDEGSSSQESST